MLGGVSGGQELAHMCLRFHGHLRQSISKGETTLIANSILTCRNLLQTVRTFHFLLTQNMEPVNAMLWAVVRNYVSSVSTEHRNRLYLVLSNEMKCAGVKSVFKKLPITNEESAPWQKDAADLTSLMASLEESLSHAICSLLTSISDATMAGSPAYYYISSILIPMHPQETDTLTNLASSIANARVEQSINKLSKALQHLFQLKRVQVHLEEYKLELTVQSHAGAVRECLLSFVTNSSLEDSKHRCNILQQVLAVLHKFDTCFRLIHSNAVGASGNALMNSVLNEIHSIQCSKVMLAWFSILHKPMVAHLREKFLDAFTRIQERGVIWAVEAEQRRPLLQSRKTISLLTNSLLNMGGSVEILPYQITAEWLGLLWFMQVNRPQVFLFVPAHDHLLQPHNLQKMEVAVCICTLKIELQGIVRDLQIATAAVADFESLAVIEREIANKQAVIDKVNTNLRYIEGELAKYQGMLFFKFTVYLHSTNFFPVLLKKSTRSSINPKLDKIKGILFSHIL